MLNLYGWLEFKLYFETIFFDSIVLTIRYEIMVATDYKCTYFQEPLELCLLRLNNSFSMKATIDKFTVEEVSIKGVIFLKIKSRIWWFSKLVLILKEQYLT